jgi:hypothetical protein
MGLPSLEPSLPTSWNLVPENWPRQPIASKSQIGFVISSHVTSA